MKDTFRITLTARISRSMDDSIMYLVQNKSYSDYSNAVRSLIDKGLQVHQLQEIQKDPEKQKEFDAKLKDLLNAENMEALAQTMTLDQLKAAKFIFSQIEEKKLKQLMFNMQAGG